jgi:hypothetical protein
MRIGVASYWSSPVMLPNRSTRSSMVDKFTAKETCEARTHTEGFG